MSILKVDTINEKTSGNGVVIPSGQKLDVSAGTFVPSAGQVVQELVTRITSNTSFSSTSYTDASGFALTITPSAATSKIRISLHIGGEINYTDSIMFLKLKRAISGGATTNIQGATVGSKTEVITSTNSSSSDYATTLNNLQFSGLIDSPNTTSAITYTPVIINIRNATHTFYYNRTVNNEDAYNRQHSVSWVTLEEVAA